MMRLVKLLGFQKEGCFLSVDILKKIGLMTIELRILVLIGSSSLIWHKINYKELAKEWGVHEVSIKKAVANLLKLGLIEQIEPRKPLFRTTFKVWYIDDRENQ